MTARTDDISTASVCGTSFSISGSDGINAQGDLSPERTISNRELARSITDVLRGLEQLIHQRENDFLQLGEAVMGFSEQSRSLSEKAMRLSRLVSAQSLEGSVAILSGQIQEILSVCNLGTTSQCLHDIDRLRRSVQSLSDRFVDFRKMVRNLQMLGIATRIESARMGDLGTGFANLSAEVDKLASTIVSKVGTIQDRTKRLEQVVQEVRSNARSILEDQARCSEGLRVDIEKSFQSLTRITQNADLFTARLLEKAQQIASSLSRIVSSLQFHDIVRQQVEHITHSLEDMVGELHGGSGNGAGDDGVEESTLLGWVKDVSRLNSAQLQNAGSRFQEAVEHIREGLRDIGSTTLEMSEEVDLLIRGESALGNDLLESLQGNTGAVVTMLVRFAESMRSIAALMKDLGVTVADMEGFLEGIEGVGEEIELIALNATISSAHTGDKGRPLSVLAEAIRQLSIQSRRDTALFTANLREITTYSEVLRKRATELGAEVAMDRLIGSQRTLLAQISEMSRSFNSLLSEVREDGTALGRRLHAQADSVSLHREICPRLDTAARELEKLTTPLPDDAFVGSRPERLESMLSRYTMEMERLVYQSTFGVDPEDHGQAETRNLAEEHQEESWDNVELF